MTPELGICQWFHFEDHRLETAVHWLNELGVKQLRTGISWADSLRPGAQSWFDRQMKALEPFDVTITFCFTPEHCGVAPHHTSPPRCVDEFAAFCAAHGNNDAYYTSYSLGLTQTGDPELDPEESTSYTLGLIFQPLSNLTFTVDWWQIEVENLIVGVTSTAEAEAQYYSNNGVVNIPGITVVPGNPDPNFPNALPILGFIQSALA